MTSSRILVFDPRSLQEILTHSKWASFAAKMVGIEVYAYSSGFSHNIITLHAKVLTFSRGYSQPLWGLHSYTPNPLIP